MKRNTKIGLAGVLWIAWFAGAKVFRKTYDENLPLYREFDAIKYLGKWYEIARMQQHPYEKNMEFVSACYKAKSNGDIKVINSGFDMQEWKWTSIEGTATYASNNMNLWALKVTFFWPFYGWYNIISIARDYQYALVVGEDTNSMWMLSREKTMPEDIKQSFLMTIKSLGFDLEKVHFTQQEI